MDLLVVDVDGVLTDGRIYIGETGEIFKAFSVKDGLGIRKWIESGNEIVIISNRSSKIVEIRCRELQIISWV